MRLSEVAHSRDNNFDTLRLLAASMVLISHSFSSAGIYDPLGVTGVTFGELGVALFFAMSGFLILKSWTLQPVLGAFALKRILRIMPALWVALVFTTLLIGPIVTAIPARDYFTSLATWKYLLAGSALWPFDGRLPGVFATNPYPNAVNGSLWTLPIEAAAYVLVGFLGITGLLRRTATLPLAFLALVGVSWYFQHDAVLQYLKLYAFFLAGMLLYAWRAHVPLSWLLAAACFALWTMSLGTGFAVVMGLLALPYVTIVLAYRTPVGLRRLVAWGDVSYGLYIYAFPVQQSIAWYIGGNVTPGWIMALSFPIAWGLGLMSWHLIERPALALRRRS